MKTKKVFAAVLAGTMLALAPLSGMGSYGTALAAKGGARISEVHANFVVNENGASADDVCALMKTMQDSVYEAFRISLEPEVRFLGFGAPHG